jgi:uncharacterized protein YfaS (alpha-2-macroglobulin family)
LMGLTEAAQTQWYITRTMIWVKAAVTEFAKNEVPVTGTTNVLFVQSTTKETVTWSKSVRNQTVTAPWTGDTETVTVSHNGDGSPWVSLQSREAIVLKANDQQGISIEKSIVNLTRGGDTDFKPGDLVEVTIKFKPAAPVYHVSLMDPIPAGSNIVTDAYGRSVSYGEKSTRGYSFYFEAVGADWQTLKYQYQINNVGTFNLPPTRIEGLYMPSIYGATPNKAIVVNK